MGWLVATPPSVLDGAAGELAHSSGSAGSAGGDGSSNSEMVLDNLLPALVQTGSIVLLGYLSARFAVLPEGMMVDFSDT
eukprot:SAG31_NODE_27398_length_426_cov_1.737003_1_plen_78_part_01